MRAVALTIMIGCAPPAATRPVEPVDTAVPATEPVRVLVITGGGHHDFARNTAMLLDGLRARGTFEFETIEVGSSAPADSRDHLKLDDRVFLEGFDAVLAYCQGELNFSPAARENLLDYIRAGGGYVGAHSAADSHPGWDEYDRMLGGRFESHPPFGDITVSIDAADHPVTRDLPREWTLRDEFYHLKNCGEEDKEVLMTGQSPGDPADAPPRPVSWVREEGEGRVFYTILGHGPETHGDERFQQLIAQAIEWAASSSGETAPQPKNQSPDD